MTEEQKARYLKAILDRFSPEDLDWIHFGGHDYKLTRAIVGLGWDCGCR